jgi:hypothetical protein
MFDWLRQSVSWWWDRAAAQNDYQTDEEVLSSGLAHYRWGSATIRFSTLAAVGKRSPAEVVVEVMTRQSTWESDARFRQTVAYLHELVHYFQDLTTGVGNWDFTRRVMAVDRLMPALVPLYDAGDGAAPDEGARTAQEALSKSIFNGWPNVDRTKQLAILTETARTNGWQPAEELAPLFTIESIFETEAVLQTLVTLSRGAVAPTAVQILRANSSIVDPLRMPAKYSGLCRFILRHTMHSTGATDSGGLATVLDEGGIGLAHVYHFYIFLIDLCCAHPPEPFFEGHTRLGLDDFLPGVRLMRYMRVLQELPDDNQPFDPHRFERRLNEACGFPYPLIDDVYLLWKNYFEEHEADDASKLRGAVAAARVNSKDAFAKIANGVAALGVPINYSIEGQPGTYTLKVNEHRWQQAFPEMQSASYWNAILFECVKAFYLQRSFSCPVAGWCPVRRPACVSGLMFPRDVPRSDQCVVNEYFRVESSLTAQKVDSDAANNDVR